MIIIPQTCKEDWNRMTPVEKGRICDKCCKTVLDFSQMSKDEVLNVLRERRKAGESICGRFRASHLTPVSEVKPGSKAFEKISRIRVFLAAVLLVFSTTLFTSCAEEPLPPVQHKIVHQDKPAKREQAFRVDDLAKPHRWVPLLKEAIAPEPPDDDIYITAGVEPVNDIYPDTTYQQ